MKYHNITKDDMLNGDGLRVVLWVSGCSHHCKGCHNKITWDCNDGLDFDDDAKLEIFKELENDYISGLTLSGGDPLFESNRETILELVKEVKSKYPHKTIWLYTGYKWEDIKDLEIMKYIDILVDGKFIKELSDSKLMWRGSSNQNIINVDLSLLYEEPVLYKKYKK